jgi:hypothetical protein
LREGLRERGSEFREGFESGWKYDRGGINTFKLPLLFHPRKPDSLSIPFLPGMKKW